MLSFTKNALCFLLMLSSAAAEDSKSNLRSDSRNLQATLAPTRAPTIPPPYQECYKTTVAADGTVSLVRVTPCPAAGSCIPPADQPLDPCDPTKTEAITAGKEAMCTGDYFLQMTQIPSYDACAWQHMCCTYLV
jgi:hypothetical protein